MLRSSVISALKRLRVSQPFNWVATTATRLLLSAAGIDSEFVVSHLHRMGEVSDTLPNGRRLVVWARADDGIANLVFWRGWAGYEAESVPLFYRLASTARVTLDIGAFVGYYALLAGHANPAGRVFAFEPMPRIHERLQHNVKVNSLTNVQCICAAVGNRDGDTEFFYSTLTLLPTMSSISWQAMKGQPQLVKGNVPVVTIDRFARERGIEGIDLVKIDTESAEPQVLQGMNGVVTRDRPAILCEVLGGLGVEGPLDDFVQCHGYHAFHLTSEGPIACKRIEAHPTMRNYLFSPTPDPEPRAATHRHR